MLWCRLCSSTFIWGQETELRVTGLHSNHLLTIDLSHHPFHVYLDLFLFLPFFPVNFIMVLYFIVYILIRHVVINIWHPKVHNLFYHPFTKEYLFPSKFLWSSNIIYFSQYWVSLPVMQRQWCHQTTGYTVAAVWTGSSYVTKALL